MNIKSIIDDIQQSIILLQERLDELKVLDNETVRDILITRQEAADLLEVSLRQFDRYCNSYGIRKITTINGVRISKREILIHMGVIQDSVPQAKTEFESIIQQSSRL
ncbi:MAG: hypothetical protein PHD21_03635 [Flavobacteriales bacterium]|nr:hypothetical protein [Flavobacteriales bacterium]